MNERADPADFQVSKALDPTDIRKTPRMLRFERTRRRRSDASPRGAPFILKKWPFAAFAFVTAIRGGSALYCESNLHSLALGECKTN